MKIVVLRRHKKKAGRWLTAPRSTSPVSSSAFSCVRPSCRLCVSWLYCSFSRGRSHFSSHPCRTYLPWPRRVVPLPFAGATLFVALFNVFRFPFLFRCVFLFASSCHKLPPLVKSVRKGLDDSKQINAFHVVGGFAELTPEFRGVTNR
jgi:hypothetical protein